MTYRILACGSNGSYQLGTGDDEDHNTLQEIKISNESKPVQFAFGGNHTLVLFEDGDVYACGDNQYGQCGFGDVSLIVSFRKVPGKWAFIAAGWEYSVLQSQNGSISTCGHGPKGELGLGPGTTKASKPTEVKLPIDTADTSIVEIKSSISHVLVRFADGKFAGWGECRKGQLGPLEYITNAKGQKKPVGMYWSPRLLDITGLLFCMGRGRSILCEEDEYRKGINIIGKDPQFISCNPLQVKAMWSSVHYSEKSSDGSLQITSHGNNLHGQLYNYESPGPIVAFEVGSEHGIALLENNYVYAWGWGEHGNCGPKQNDSVTFDYLNPIYSEKHPVELLACGLATTWIVVKEE